MALCRLPNSALFASRDRPSAPSASKLSLLRLGWGAQQSPSCRAFLLVCAAKSSRNNRKSRATKSNAELCDELREFILVVGLPEHHVPSTKELLEHGRKDLANIVRRRGHRIIAKLLANPPNGDIIPPDVDSAETKASDEQYVGSPFEVMVGVEQNGALEKVRGADSHLSSLYVKEQYSVREDAVSALILDDSLYENSSSSLVDVEAAGEEEEDEAKINHLRELLRKKELELSILKQQLEEEKLALSAMQNKVLSELSKVENDIASKDQELQTAEESLSGLKEVILEFWGNADTVEVTGSFNGWQHRLKMDPQMPSKAVNTTDTREATLWSAVLWLYPGVYEIKFVVDGHWKIDPQREFVSKENVVNNILRVDGNENAGLRQTT